MLLNDDQSVENKAVDPSASGADREAGRREALRKLGKFAGYAIPITLVIASNKAAAASF